MELDTHKLCYTLHRTNLIFESTAISTTYYSFACCLFMGNPTLHEELVVLTCFDRRFLCLSLCRIS